MPDGWRQNDLVAYRDSVVADGRYLGFESHEAARPALASEPLDLAHQRGAGAVPLLCGVHGEDLARIPGNHVSEHPGKLPVLLGEQAGVIERALEPSHAGDSL
jgi:hypothetical protein